MRVVIQRVLRASVSEKSEGMVGSIGPGMVILLGVAVGDTQADAQKLCRKIAALRIFEDSAGLGNMNLSLEAKSELQIMVISQFTLYADTRKGNRPSYLRSAKGDVAEPLYSYFCDHLSQITGRDVARGVFGGDMAIELVNDGPVTIIIDSQADL